MLYKYTMLCFTNHFFTMEQLNTNTTWKKWWIKSLWTTLMLVWLLLTQNPQAVQAQNIRNNKPKTEEVINDSTIQWEFTPELIASIWYRENNKFVIHPEYLRRDDNMREYITINWNNYYSIDEFRPEEYTWLWYHRLTNYSRFANWFFIGSIKKDQIWSNGILIQPNWDKYQGHFEDELYEKFWTIDFWDWRHYEGDFHEWEMDWKWVMTWKNWDHYEWDFVNSKRSWEGSMNWHYWESYQWTWENDSPIKDPRERKNPLILGKWTYYGYWDIQTTYEITSANRPKFISVEDKKWKENRDKRRGNIIYITRIQDWQKSFELHSWDRDISYSLDDSHFVFSSKDWAILKFPKEIGEKKAKAIANLINSVMSMVKNNDEWYRLYAFDYQWNTLQAQYRWKFFDVDIVKNIPWKIGISAKEFSDWLNHYRLNKPDWEY